MSCAVDDIALLGLLYKSNKDFSFVKFASFSFVKSMDTQIPKKLSNSVVLALSKFIEFTKSIGCQIYPSNFPQELRYINNVLSICAAGRSSHRVSTLLRFIFGAEHMFLVCQRFLLSVGCSARRLSSGGPELEMCVHASRKIVTVNSRQSWQHIV